MQLQEKIHISKLNPEDIKRVLEIADAGLGKHYIRKDILLDPNVFTYVAFSDSRDIAGFSCGKVIRKTGRNEILKRFSPQIIREIAGYKKIGLSMSSAIRNDMKGKGYGTALFQKKIDTFKEKSVDIILMQGWQQPDGTTPIDNVAKRFGFEKLGIETNFFFEDSIRKGYHCPVCGLPPCHCGAIIYLKKIQCRQ